MSVHSLILISITIWSSLRENFSITKGITNCNCGGQDKFGPTPSFHHPSSRMVSNKELLLMILWDIKEHCALQTYWHEGQFSRCCLRSVLSQCFHRCVTFTHASFPIQHVVICLLELQFPSGSNYCTKKQLNRSSTQNTSKIRCNKRCVQVLLLQKY